MPVCGHPIKNGAPCKRKSPYCWQHRTNRWHSAGKRALAFMAVIGFLSIFVETPRIKFSIPKVARKGLPPNPPVGLSVVVDSDEPARPSLLTAHSAAPKIGHPAADVSQPTRVSEPANVIAGIFAQLSLPHSVALAETNSTTDSVTALVNQPSASNVFSVQQIPTATFASLEEPYKSSPGLLDTRQMIALPSSTSLAEPDKSALATFVAVQQQALSPVLTNFSEVSKPLPGFWEQQTPTLASRLAAAQTVSGGTGVQQIPGLNSLTTGSLEGQFPIQGVQTLNPAVQ